MTQIQQREALEEQREFLLGSLRKLEREHDAGEIDESDYVTLREDYTARAAAVLRELEEGDAPAEGETRIRRGSGTTARAARQSGGSRVRRKGASGSDTRVQPRAYIIGVLVAVLVGAAVGVLAFSTDRAADDAPVSASANTLAQAHELEGQGKAAEALKLYDDVLKTEPGNVEALTYKGWLLALAGLTDPAMESLDRAVAADPRYADAHFFRGMVLYRQRNDPAAAIPEFEAFLASNPPANSVPAVQNVLDQARQAAASPPTPPAG